MISFKKHKVKRKFEKSFHNFSLDATNSRRIGRYINDSSRAYINSSMKKVIVNNQPKLCLFALKEIDEGTEIRYDYGEPSSVLPWRKEVC